MQGRALINAQMSGVEGQAEMLRSVRALPVLTRHGHGHYHNVETIADRFSRWRFANYQARSHLDDAKRQFKTAWARFRESLTEAEIAHAHRAAEINAEALTRYDTKRAT
jgi:hypothetical protein